MSANDYFKNDEYWANHINKDLEEVMDRGV